jgi:ribonuclease T1
MPRRMPRQSSRQQLLSIIVLAGLLTVAALWSLLREPGQADRQVAPAGPPPARATLAQQAPSEPLSGLPTIAADRLPPEAHDTLALIERGGPFPYERDGLVFQNREGLLPRHPSGYYREYTVVTPGSDDRGARRIIAGRAGEIYYTDDHYASFSQVLP